MSAKTIRIESVNRVGASGESDSLTLEAGVNVIVGEKGTGKTAWLRTISFLLGDTDPAEEALKPEIATKFDSASLLMKVGDADASVERRWKEAGQKTSIIFDGKSVKREEFSQFFLPLLGIPIVMFPKGSPYSGSKWPPVSWRMLFRHIYRQERFWTDLADRQPEKEQHACIAQFLGVADRLYPSELGQEIDKQRELLTLEARKEQFEDILQHAARDIVPDPAISNSPTLEAIDRGVGRLLDEIDRFRREREAALTSVLEIETDSPSEPADTKLAERRLRISTQRDAKRELLAEVEKRFEDLSTYREQVKAELGRLQRVEVAGSILKPLTVTCCPNCDQKVTAAHASDGHCFLCHQTLPAEDADEVTGASKRLAFEIEQLTGEESELADMIGRLAMERDILRSDLRRLDGELAEVEVQLRPLRTVVAAVLPPEVFMLDTRVGQWEEKVAQLKRLRRAVEHRDELSAQIDRLRAEVETLSGQVDTKNEVIPYEQLSDAMSDGINDYLNLLNEEDRNRWPHPRVRFDFTSTSVRVRVGTKSWTSLSNADQGYVLLGYHYALLNLSGKDGFNYPGIALIDFPMNFGDKTSVADRENFLIEPFVTLARGNSQVQVIVCGRSFAGLKGVNRIELSHVWRQGDSPIDVNGQVSEPQVSEDSEDR
jgi:DNA repair ATPase RecN